MKHQLKLVFTSPKFVVGFIIMMLMLLTAILYPAFSSADPLEMVGGLFYEPGTYISTTDTIETKQYHVTLDTVTNKLAMNVSEDEQVLMRDWLTHYGHISAEQIMEADEPARLIALWIDKYDENIRVKGTSAYRKKFPRLFKKVENILHNEGYAIMLKDSDSGELKEVAEVGHDSYVNTKDIPNQITLILGTDNFGRNVAVELIYAIGNSLKVGLIAGTIATFIGLIIGLLAGYIGGFIDNVLTFMTNMFTVIPSFIILILISVSLGDQGRSLGTIAIVIGITAWPWTARAVRAQTITLRNRDHVNLSKLSGHRLVRILLTDILPYVASYVVMACILQIASGILAEAQLSMLGLGPSTSKIATLGLMLNWAIQFQAPLSNAWWAFLPVILFIALISFSLNLMNTGLDQVFNPQLRE
ncbi:ABC transporter permease [Vallitalea pronyensis]|uniref:ABC transporter permease n=1 Tax=Vallitalea pronyensis TaxID=1348613 RepID=A0A8J8SIU4_9FIRM|nr:ABC transporter permease [Vallitalea pronyensis]QUI24809.1 ABC transporter permease [Vallitalea pronyensis]